MESQNRNSAEEYLVDAWQRSILFMDTLRERGNRYLEHSASPAPNVLTFGAEVVQDGRTLERPVNYVLARILPPEGTVLDPLKPPFVIVDPRAGHGPGIGGMKEDSEIGVALANGHACYFIGFFPDPVPGQSIEDVIEAEATFIRTVAVRHPEAEAKPVIIANCQAGWQTMIMSALNPDLAGPLMIVGSPLSYWAGVRGGRPMRYSGGILGGTWATAMAGDIGGGIFDGANLVANFEKNNPANTYFKKAYDLYTQVDTGAERFLDFETWWGSPVLLNAEEMEWIADNLFVGNKLTSGELVTRDDVRIDLRNIRSPILAFCSWGDDITPPQQALGWITDLYETDEELAANGQTIIYSTHPTIGHLGIFVSSKVAQKEHGKFTACMDQIEILPPGLYEAVITDAEEGGAAGPYLIQFRLRTLDDIRALGNNSPEDQRRFETVARVSEVNKGLYSLLLRPALRAMTTPQMAEALRELHPHRMRFALWSDQNPAMATVRDTAKRVRRQRAPMRPDNPYLRLQSLAADSVVAGLEAFGKLRDRASEDMFLSMFGSPVLQAAVGLAGDASANGPRIERDLAREATALRERARLEKAFDAGGIPEAVVRAFCYVAQAEGAADERSFAVLREVREAMPPALRPGVAALKAVLRDQSALLRLDMERAVKTLPSLLPDDGALRSEALEALRRAVLAPGVFNAEAKRRLARMSRIFSDPTSAERN